MFSIGEVAVLKGITVKALRFYEEIDLLKPAYINPLNNYRYYSKDQFLLIDIIKAVRALEMSPNSMIPLFKSKDSNQLIESLLSHKEDIKKKIQLFERIMLQIDAVEGVYKQARASLLEKDVYIKEMDRRLIVTLPMPSKPTHESMETCYSKLEMQVYKNGYVNTYETGILLNSEIQPEKIFNVVVNTPESMGKDCEIIEGGSYICINYSEQNLKQQQAKLNRYLNQHRIEPKKILQMYLLVDIFEESEAHFELQVQY